MENMINLQNENRLSSIEVGEMLNKEHKHVMRDIRGIIADLEEPSEAVSDLFIETTYIHPQNGQQYPMYLLSKEGCELYGTRLIGKVGTQFARKYVKQFNAMQAQQAGIDLNKDSYMIEDRIERAKRWAEEQQEFEDAKLLLVESTDKAEAFDNLVTTSKSTYNTSEVAKIFGLTARELNQYLSQRKVHYHSAKSKTWLLYAKYARLEYKAPSVTREGHYTSHWTTAGLDFITKMLIEDGYPPIHTTLDDVV